MPTQNFLTKEQVWSELDTLGEDRVQDLVAAGEYGRYPQAFVEEWLRRKSDERANVAILRERKREQLEASTPRMLLSIAPKNTVGVIVAAAAIVLVMVTAVVMSLR